MWILHPNHVVSYQYGYGAQKYRVHVTKNMVMQTSSSLSAMGNLIEDVRILMKQFSRCTVQHVRRTANEAAHLLAKNALLIDEDLYHVEDCLAFLFPVVINDCNYVST